MKNSPRSNESLFARAQQFIPGGVNSPVRAFRSVGGTPRFIVEGKGVRIRDCEGKTYIDLVGSWGPLILGHADEGLLETLRDTLARGTSFGAPTPREIDLAERITQLVPSIEKVRLVNSGTEATMSAIRLARGATGRDLIVKFAGCYHGHVDSLLVAAGSGATTFGVPDSAGIPAAIAATTRVLPFNDLDALETLFRKEGAQIAGVILEPVCGNMGCVPPKPGYLAGVRELCTKSGALLIFDEVMTGFRVALGGAQERYGITPDLTCLGKIIGGGLPVGAYGGRRDLMAKISPEGPVYQAGTLSGNPLAVAAGLYTLDRLSAPGVFANFEKVCNEFGQKLSAEIASRKLPLCLNQVGSMFTLFFQEGPVENYDQALSGNKSQFPIFFHALLEAGIYWPPSAYEAAFLSLAHSSQDLEQILAGVGRALDFVEAGPATAANQKP